MERRWPRLAGRRV